MRPPGRPGSPGRAGGALRERGHGGGDRPIPSRTRQLSPPSPKVLRIRSAGGRDAALAQGASAPIGGRARAGEGPQGPFRASRGASRPPFLFYVESQPAQAFCMLEDWISRLLTLLASGHYFLFTDCLTIYSRRLALCRTFFCIGRYWFANSQDEQALLLFTTFPRDEFELSIHSSPLLGMNPYFSETLHQSGVQ